MSEEEEKIRRLKQKSIETHNAVWENMAVNAKAEEFSVTIPTVLPLLSEDNHAKKEDALLGRHTLYSFTVKRETCIDIQTHTHTYTIE